MTFFKEKILASNFSGLCDVFQPQPGHAARPAILMFNAARINR
jgi:hypothetical protein